MAKPWKSPNYANRDCWTAEQCLNGRRLSEEAARWIERNPQDFMGLYNMVKDFQALGYRGRLRDRVVTEALKRGVRLEKDGFKFTNGLWAGVSRYMAILDPTLVGNPIEFGRSDIDTYGLVPVTIELPGGALQFKDKDAK